MLIRQASEAGSLYGSVTARDIAIACGEAGLTIDRDQVKLDQPIKTLGLSKTRVALHPEVIISVTINVARTAEEAEKQARGEAITREEDEDDGEKLILGEFTAEDDDA